MGLEECFPSAAEQLYDQGHVSWPVWAARLSFQSFQESVSSWCWKGWGVCSEHSVLAPSTVLLQHCRGCGLLDWKEGQPVPEMLVSNQQQARKSMAQSKTSAVPALPRLRSSAESRPHSFSCFSHVPARPQSPHSHAVPPLSLRCRVIACGHICLLKCERPDVHLHIPSLPPSRVYDTQPLNSSLLSG